MYDVIWALFFSIINLADCFFHLLISESCGEGAIRCWGFDKGSGLSVDISTDKLVHVMVAPTFDQVTGCCFCTDLRRLKDYHAFLLEWVMSILKFTQFHLAKMLPRCAIGLIHI